MTLQRRRFLQLAAATAVMPPFGARAAAPLKARVGSGHGLGAAQAFYAQELGIYKRHDLEVDLQIPVSLKYCVDQITASKMDIGNGNVISIAGEGLKGNDLVIIAPGVNYDSDTPTTVLVQAPFSDFKTGKELEGKTVATLEENDLAQFSVKYWIDKTGGDSSKVNFLHGIPMGDVGEPLNDKRIAAALIANPAWTNLRTAGKVKLLANTFELIGTTFLPAAFFARRDWVTANREATHRFAAAINETAEWANTHHDETVKLVAKLTKTPESQVGQMFRAGYPGKIELEAIQRPLDVAIKYGFIKPVKAQDIVIDTLKG